MAVPQDWPVMGKGVGQLRLHRLGDLAEFEKNWGPGVFTGWRCRIAR